MNGTQNVYSGGGGSNLRGDIFSQLQGSRGMPGNINYLMQLLSMMPQGGGQGGGQQTPPPPQHPYVPPSQAGLQKYLGQSPTNQAGYLGGQMSGATSDLPFTGNYFNNSNFFGLLQSLLGVNPIQYGR